MISFYHKNNLKLYYGKKTSKDFSNIIYVEQNDLELPYGITFMKKPTPFINNLSSKSIRGQTMSSLFKHENFSWWWIILPTINYSICSAVNFIDRFEKMVEKINPSTIVMNGDFKNFSLVKQICKKKKIPFSYNKSSYFQHKVLKKAKQNIQSYRHDKIFHSKFHRRLKLFNSTIKIFPSFENKLVLFSATTYRRQYSDIVSGKQITKEFLLEPIITALQLMSEKFVGIDVDYTFKGDTEILKQRLNDHICWVPLESLLHKHMNKSHSQNFLKVYNKVINQHEFKELFNFNNVNFWENVKYDFLKMTFSSYFPFLIELKIGMEKFFKKNRPKSILIPYEKGSFALILLSICRKLGIDTIGIQHGAFDSLEHLDYTHTDIQSENNPYGIPIPDITLLWGDSAKRFLIKCGYPEEKLVVVGNPEFFKINEIKKNLENQDLNKKYGIKKDRKIILFTTSKLQTGYLSAEKRSYDEQVLKKLLELFANNKKYFVIVKPHPVNEPIITYENLLKKFNCDNFKLIQENVLELIYISDVLISVQSSTIIDAIGMGTMVIELIFNDSSFMNSNVAEKILLISNLENLEFNIRKSLQDKEFQNRIRKNQSDFLLDHYNVPSHNYQTLLKQIFST